MKLEVVMSEPDEGKQWIDPTSPPAGQLRDIIFDNRWLNSLQNYTRNRHTGKLEVGYKYSLCPVLLYYTLFAYHSPFII